MNNYFQCAPKHLLIPFFKGKIKVFQSALGATKTESGYNTRCRSFCSAIKFVMRQVDCVNEPVSDSFRLWGRRKLN